MNRFARSQRGVSLAGRTVAVVSPRATLAGTASWQGRPRRTTTGSGARATRGAKQAGFTLVELLVALMVAAILVVVAVPNFRSMMLANQLTTRANSVLGALSAARMEAIKRNTSAMVCGDAASGGSDPLSAACDALPASERAGAVFLLVASKATSIQAGLGAGSLTMDGGFAAVRFGGDGLAHPAGSSAPFDDTVVDLCTAALGKDNHRKLTLSAGSITRIQTLSGACS